MYKFGGGLVFSLCFCLFEMNKKHFLLLWGKEGIREGRKDTTRVDLALLSQKNACFPQFKAEIALNVGRKRTFGIPFHTPWQALKAKCQVQPPWPHRSLGLPGPYGLLSVEMFPNNLNGDMFTIETAWISR